MKGLGNDIIAVSRIKGNIDRHGFRFLDKVFTVKEKEYCLRYRTAERHFAGRFAAKEAIVKALGIGFSQGIGWLDIEIINDSYGKPQVFCSQMVRDLFGNPHFLLSISHCHEFASAVAIWL